MLIAATIIYNLSTGALITSVLLDAPFAVTLLTAVGVGLGFTSAGAAVRARWSYRLRGTPLLNTAFALEAVLDEVVFIVGPVLVTFLATAIHPALGLAAGGVLGLVGAFAARRPAGHPAAPGHAGRHGGRRTSGCRSRLLLPIVFACAALGMLFGGMEVVVVAFADEAGVLPYAGVIVMAWACGSLIAGVVTGTIRWQAGPAKRFRVGAVLLAALAAAAAVRRARAAVGRPADPERAGHRPDADRLGRGHPGRRAGERLTEALGWTSMGMAGGVGLRRRRARPGDRHGRAQAGFFGVIGAGLVLIVAALLRADPARRSTACTGAGRLGRRRQRRSRRYAASSIRCRPRLETPSR